MPCESNDLDLRCGDSEHNLLRKILGRLKQLVGLSGDGVVGNVSLTVSDIEIGAVELKDSESDNRVRVVDSCPGADEFGVVVRAVPCGVQPVSGPLTDAELRASPISVDGAFLTDAQLRATPVPVSGTVSVNEPVSVDDNGGSLTVDTPQLPAALVGGRLDSNIGSWLGSTAPTVGQKTMVNSVPVTIASDQSGLAVTGPLTDVQLRAVDVPVNVRPFAYGALGHYRAAFGTGTMAAGIAANSQILQFRYTGANLAVIYDVTLDEFRSLGTAFAAGNWLFSLTRITGWTIDGTGGTVITPLKMRSSMGNAVATTRFATTAALGAGTSTLDATSMRDIRGIIGTAANQIQTAPFQTTATAVLGRAPSIPFILIGVSTGEHPLVLATNEGFALRVTVPATGTWQAVMNVKWAEVATF